MERDQIWSVLGISETTEEAEIKKAYRDRLVLVNPEDDEKGFMQLREAYEQALDLLRHPVTGEKEQKPKDEFDIWIAEAASIYEDITQRRDVTKWEKFLANDLCVSLDTWHEARERFLVFLMDQFFLPKKVWELFDSEFHIQKDKEVLLQKFPKDFIEYCIRQILYEQYLNYDWFEVKNGEKVNADSIMNQYYSLRRSRDAGNDEEVSRILEELLASPLYHPSFEAEKLQGLVCKLEMAAAPRGEEENPEAPVVTLDESQKAQLLSEMKDLAMKLSPYVEDEYMAYFVAKSKWHQDDIEGAVELYQAISAKNPEHYGARVGMLDYYLMKGEYKKAHEESIELLDIYPYEDELEAYLTRANDGLIPEYKKTCEEEPENIEILVELAWCYYQNDRYDECFAILDQLPESEQKKPDYYKLRAYVFMKKQQMQESLRYLLMWYDIVPDMEDEKKRARDSIRSNFLIGVTYLAIDDYRKSLPYLLKAVELEQDPRQKLREKERLTFNYLKLREYEKCIDLATQLLEEDTSCLPALIYRQEAFDAMGNGQEVINDYFKIVEMFPAYYWAYTLAARVFYDGDQYEDSMKVVRRAKEAGVDDPSILLLEAQNKRCMAETKEDREKALELLKDVQVRLDKQLREAAEKDPSNAQPIHAAKKDEVLYELACAYSSLERYDEALKEIRKAILMKPADETYVIYEAFIYMDMEWYDEAMPIFKMQLKHTNNQARIYYHMAQCLKSQKKTDEAVACFQKVLESNPQSVNTVKGILDTYMDKFQATQDMTYYQKAKPYAEQLLGMIHDCYHFVHVGLFYESGYDLRASLECYQKASECDEKDIWPHNNAGYSLKILRRLDEAIDELQTAISMLEPNKEHLPYSNLADCYEILGLYEEAHRCCDRILGFLQRDWVYVEKAKLYRKQGQPDQAIRMHEKRLTIKGANAAEIYADMMVCVAEAGDMANTKKYAKLALLIDKKQCKVHKKIADTYFGMGMHKEALHHYMLAEKLLKDDDAFFAELTSDIAFCFYDCGKLDKARLWAKRSYDSFLSAAGTEEKRILYMPRRPYWLTALGRKHFLLGDVEKALQYFSYATTDTPCRSCRSKGCHDGYFGLAVVYHSLGQMDKAIEALQKALENDSRNTLYKRKLSEWTTEKQGETKK